MCVYVSKGFRICARFAVPNHLESLVKLWQYAAQLKAEERRGWKRLGLTRIESVADHSFGLAMLAWLEAERRKYDVGMVLKLALIHDLEEAITGDLTPADKRVLGAPEVHGARRRAMDELIKNLPSNLRGSYRRLWTDLRLLRTKEALLVHELDKLEMAFQAARIGRRVGRTRVKNFFQSAAREIKDPELSRVLNQIAS